VIKDKPKPGDVTIEIDPGDIGPFPEYFDVVLQNAFNAQINWKLYTKNGGGNCRLGGLCSFSVANLFDGEYGVRARSGNAKGESRWVYSVNPIVLPLNKKYSTTPPFKDISKQIPDFKTSIIWLYQFGVTTGYDCTAKKKPDAACTKKGDYVYRPGKAVTRAQMAMFLYRAAGEPKLDSKWKTPFKDISKQSKDFQNVIKWAYNVGITTGTDATHYSPTKSVTRGQMAGFLYRLALKPPVDPYWKTPFVDISDYSLFKEIIWLYNVEITTGTDKTHYSPRKPVTRAQMAAFLKRFVTKGEYEGK
jgi:hypothetical protein